MRMLVVGGTGGQLSRALKELEAGPLEVFAEGRPGVDLAEPRSLFAAVERYAPDVVVCSGAHTAVDLAESEPDVAHAVNAVGPAALAQACAAAGVPLVHVSTDYVFDGASPTPYREADPTSPASVYGRTKLAGEVGVAAAGGRSVILRTSWVYSDQGRNFVRTMLKLARSRDVVRVVDDQTGYPTYAPFLAGAVAAVATRLVNDAGVATGVFHAAGRTYCTWADLAEEVFAASAARGGPAARVERIPTSEYPTPARRPANSALDGRGLTATYGVEMPDWREGVRACLDRIASTGWPE
jgi:dTDP-4-dehydrorhamnose reductase